MGERFERLERFGRNAERFARNDWNGERNAERFARNDSNRERNAERFARNDFSGVVVRFRVCNNVDQYFFGYFKLAATFSN